MAQGLKKGPRVRNVGGGRICARVLSLQPAEGHHHVRLLFVKRVQTLDCFFFRGPDEYEHQFVEAEDHPGLVSFPGRFQVYLLLLESQSKPALYSIDGNHPQDSDVVFLQGRMIVQDVHVDVVEAQRDSQTNEDPANGPREDMPFRMCLGEMSENHASGGENQNVHYSQEYAASGNDPCLFPTRVVVRRGRRRDLSVISCRPRKTRRISLSLLAPRGVVPRLEPSEDLHLGLATTSHRWQDSAGLF
mmetsp:Transcript_54821/g.134085  ORF Transcript_54821/g.134085 Transcript_54821/m.134085 type:complete len:246 (+) Transcript_54821:2791-3528(+)